MKKHHTPLTILALILILAFGLSSCNMEEDDSSADDSQEAAEVDAGESGEEHGSGESEGAEHSGSESSGEESGEESGTQYAKTDTYDETRNGARLVISYDEETQAFTGTVENTTEETLTRVRVEVHLSNGTELGPTVPTELEAGASMEVTLAAVDEEFDTWGAHPEVGESSGSEHGSEENHD